MKIRFNLHKFKVGEVGTWTESPDAVSDGYRKGIWFVPTAKFITYYIDTDLVTGTTGNLILIHIPLAIRMYREQLLEELI